MSTGAGAGDESLVERAARARECALAPHSNFCVGAALEASDGSVFTGCNIESAAYGHTVCAERVALWKALSEGARAFRGIAVVSGAGRPAPPCGACRQLLWEFCGDVPVTLANLRGESVTLRVSELLPRPFDESFLDDPCEQG